MVRPVNNEDDLQRLTELEDSELRPEFVHALNQIKKIIQQQAKPLMHGSMRVTGRMLAHLSELYVDAINKGSIPAIEDSWSMLSERECLKAAAGARQMFATLIEEARAMTMLKDANSFLKASIRKARDAFLLRAVGDAKEEMSDELVAELKTQAEACLSEIKMRVRERIKGDIADLEKRAVRECTTVEEVAALFSKAQETVEGDATRAIWFSEAYDALSRSVSIVTRNLEKMRDRLQIDLERAELNLTKAEAQHATRVSSLERELEDVARRESSLTERAESAEQGLADLRRQHDELEIKFRQEREESHTRMAELQQQIETIDQEAEQRGRANAEDNSEQVADLTLKLTQKDVIIAQLSDESNDAADRLRKAEEEARQLREEMNAIPALRSKLEEAELKTQQFEQASAAAKEELESLRIHHEEEATSIQSEAMETVAAIRQLMNAEREKWKKAKAKHESALKHVEDKMAAKEEAHNDALRDAEERVAKRDLEMGELRRSAKQKEESLRGEIDRYSVLFKEQQGGLDRHRKEFADQLREARASALLIANEHKEAAREAEKKRRDLETELATLTARFDASERRKASLEDELVRARDMLSKNKNSSVEMTRLTQELSLATQQKDAAEASLKAARIATDAALKSEQDTRRKCESDITKLKMRYERQLSVLESRLLE